MAYTAKTAAEFRNQSGTLAKKVADEFALVDAELEAVAAGAVTLANTKIFVGSAGNVATAQTMSGDATIAANGALTIAADAVSLTKMANITRGSIIVGEAADAPTLLDAKTSGRILVGDGTDLKSVAVSGDATLASTGALTIAADAVELSMMADLAQGSIIVGGAANAPTALDCNDAGKILVGDGTDLKSVAVSGDATLAATGALTIAAEAVTVSKMADLTRGSIIVGQADDRPGAYDAGDDGKILIGDGTDLKSVAVSGDVTIANTGAVTIANEAVTVGKMADLAQGSVLIGAASDRPEALDVKGDGKILVGNGTTATSVAVSGDATLANTGALTLDADQKRRFVNLTAMTGTNTAMATTGVDLASGSPISVYGHFFPKAATLIGLHDFLTEAYVKDTDDAKIEVFNDAATKLFTRTLTAGGEAAKAAHTTAPEAGVSAVAAGTAVYLTATNTGAGSGTGHAIVVLEFTEA